MPDQSDSKLISALQTFWQNTTLPQSALIAVSGGPDSLALLHALLCIQSNVPNLQLVVGHFNHLIRGEEAQADARFVTDFCRSHGLECVLDSFDVPRLAQEAGLSLEDAARQARYAFLGATAARLGIELILTAHTADDQAETLMLRLLRGTGPTGLAGMRPLGPLPPVSQPALIAAFGSAPGNVQLGRPLLTVWRREVEAYCADHALTPRYDATNDEIEYRRNKIRHDLLPRLETDYETPLRANLTRLAELVQADEDWLTDLVQAEFVRHARQQTRPFRQVTFDRVYFLAQPLALQRRLVRRAVAFVTTLHNLDYQHVEALIENWQTPVARPLTLPAGLIGFRQADQVGLRQVLPPLTWEGGPRELTVPGELSDPAGRWRLEVKELQIEPGQLDFQQSDNYQVRLDRAKIGGGLTVRPRQPGERLRPLGAPGRRKVQDVMSEAHLPREWRDAWPLVVQAGPPETICWIPGLVVGEEFKLEETTTTIYDLRFTIYDFNSPGSD